MKATMSNGPFPLNTIPRSEMAPVLMHRPEIAEAVPTHRSRGNNLNALSRADLLCSAPAPAVQNPLDTIPTDWLPSGETNRPFQAKTGFIVLQSGKATVSRDDKGISVTSPGGNFTLTPDPDKPGNVLVDTPQGKFSGKLTRKGNKIEFRTADGKQGVTIERGKGYTRFDTKGFGIADHGHMIVKDK